MLRAAQRYSTRRKFAVLIFGYVKERFDSESSYGIGRFLAFSDIKSFLRVFSTNNTDDIWVTLGGHSRSFTLAKFAISARTNSRRDRTMARIPHAQNRGSNKHKEPLRNSQKDTGERCSRRYFLPSTSLGFLLSRRALSSSLVLTAASCVSPFSLSPSAPDPKLVLSGSTRTSERASERARSDRLSSGHR